MIGITGSIGAGKSTVAGLFRRWGALVISGDQIAREVISDSATVRRKLINQFGDDIRAGKSIDRAALARRALADRRSTMALNRIMHPPIIRRINQKSREALAHPRIKAVVIDAALLVEWGRGHIHWDVLVGVGAPVAVRSKRLKERGLSDSQVRAFSRAQMPWREKRKYCDEVIINDSSLHVLETRARLCWRKLLSSKTRAEDNR